MTRYKTIKEVPTQLSPIACPANLNAEFAQQDTPPLEVSYLISMPLDIKTLSPGSDFKVTHYDFDYIQALKVVT